MIFSSLALHNMPFDIQRLSFLIFGIFDQEYVQYTPHYELKLGEKNQCSLKFFLHSWSTSGALYFLKKILILAIRTNGFFHVLAQSSIFSMYQENNPFIQSKIEHLKKRE